MSDSTLALNTSSVENKQLLSQSQESLNRPSASPSADHTPNQSQSVLHPLLTHSQSHAAEYVSESESLQSSESETSQEEDQVVYQQPLDIEPVVPVQQQSHLTLPIRNDTTDNRSTISAASSTTMGTQVIVNTALHSKLNLKLMIWMKSGEKKATLR